MRATVLDLKHAFLAQCRRMINTQVTSEESIDAKRVSTTRNYTGVPMEMELIQEQAAMTDTNVSSISPGNVYFTDGEVISFLNSAWEKLHEDKCRNVKGALMDPNSSPSTIESMIYEHDQLYQSAPSVKQFTPSAPWFSRNDVQAMANQGNSVMFLLDGDMTSWGPPTVVSVALLEYPNQWTGARFPLVTKVCKLVGLHEIAGFINLAMNSRYSSGALYVHRKNFLEKNQDIIEIFHKQESESNFGGFAAAITYIRYPKPMVVEDLDTKIFRGENLRRKGSRIVEVSYGYEIALTAAMMAMNKMQ